MVIIKLKLFPVKKLNKNCIRYDIRSITYNIMASMITLRIILFHIIDFQFPCANTIIKFKGNKTIKCIH